MQRTIKSHKNFSSVKRDDRPGFLSLDDWTEEPDFLESTPKNTSRSRLLDTPWPGQECKSRALQSTPDLQKPFYPEDKTRSKDQVNKSQTRELRSRYDDKRIYLTQNHKTRPGLEDKFQERNGEEIKAKSESCYNEHLHKTFQAIKFIRNLPPVDLAQLKLKRLNLPKKVGYKLKKTIIFDLDETLVHCVDDDRADPEVVVDVDFGNGEIIPVGFNIRPYAREVLQEANKYFEVVVFTASQKPYADSILDYLDPDRSLIHHRLYRGNCLMVEGVYMKDLRIFNNRRIQDLVIVDNLAYSFGYHLDNGIPIISWHDDPYDRELFNLIHYLKILARCEDVRVLNRQYFKLKTFYEDYIQVYKKRNLSPSGVKSPCKTPKDFQ